MRTRVFTVSEETWIEHLQAGVAAINDPYAEVKSPQAHATRQRAMTEVSGIRPGDRLFFYVQRTKVIMGGFEAITAPFYSETPLSDSARIIDRRFPFRVGFHRILEYPRPLHVNEIWAGRDAGKIWTMQQARGDVIGRHSCWPLTLQEGNLLEQMLEELNTIILKPDQVFDPPAIRNPLPYDYKLIGVRSPHLNYEATLQSLILEGLADGKWIEIFGEYDDYLPYVSTSEGKEIDLLLLKHGSDHDVLWYQLLELKSDRFRISDLLQLLAYETWLTSSGQVGGNPRAVHMVAVAARYDEDVIAHIAARSNLKQKPIRLLTYKFDTISKSLIFKEIKP